MKQYEIPLQEGMFYHIYNKGINGANLFYEERNYGYFLQKYAHYMADVVDTYAYCLLKNHFHLLIRVKENFQVTTSKNLTGLEDLSGLKSESDLSGLKKENGLHHPDRIISKRFADLFNAYTKSINKTYNRTGSLFETPFKRIAVEDSSYFTRLVWYIHSNPQKHGFVENFRDYPHSSYHSFLVDKPTRLAKHQVMEWFGNTNSFTQFHNDQLPEKDISDFLIEFD
jgi:REP element-mobilizing transposase RayT